MELLANNCIQVVARDLSAPAKKSVTLPPGSVQQIGFAHEEGILPFPNRSFWGYRLLQEYFTFPEKFLFIDIGGFEKLAAAGFGKDIELIFLISDFERHDLRQTLELGLSEKGIFARLHAGGEFVRADLRTNLAGTETLRISNRSRCAGASSRWTSSRSIE